MPLSPARRRIIERRVAAAVIGLAAMFAIAALAARVGWFSFELPPPPGLRWAAFNLYLWLLLVLKGFVLAVLLGGVMRVLTRRRWATRWIAMALPVMVCLSAAVLHLAFFGMTERRIDRVAGAVDEPVLFARAVAVSGTVTFVLAAVFLCVTGLRHTPRSVRESARTMTATLAGLLLVLFWLQMIVPMTNAWNPESWYAPGLLVPFRPCRGATLWQTSAKDLPTAYRVALIDDVWLHFADPRANGARVWAVSATGQWEEGYFWLNRADVAPLWVRRDDPAVVRCDTRARPEPVAPAEWHRMGLR